MQYRKFGKTCIDVPLLGFGMMRLPVTDNDTKNINYPEAEKMLDLAIANGVTYLDTAYPYHGGESEIFTGNYLQKKGNRQQIMLATKMPVWLLKDEQDAQKYFDEQLLKLKTDYIDFYLLHALNKQSWKDTKKLNVLAWAEKMKKEGKIKYFGFSFHDDYPVFKKIIKDYDKWDFCQIQLNYMDIHYQAGMKGLKFAHAHGLGVIVMEPLRGGQIAKQPPEAVQKYFAKLPEKMTPADASLQWLWHHSEVTLILSGMSTLEQVQQNLESVHKAKIDYFREKELKIFKKIRKEYTRLGPIPCTSCKYCISSCPKEIPIPQILQLYNQVIMYDDLKRMKFFYKWISEDKRADKCINCRKCEGHCPQKIKIADWLKDIHKVLED